MDIISKYIKEQNNVLTYVILNENTSDEDIMDIIKNNKSRLINCLCLLDKHCKIVNGLSKLDEFNKAGIKIYCDGVMKNLVKIENDIMYIDYGKDIDKDEKLYIEGMELYEVVNLLCKATKTKVIIFKIPKKFDFKKFVNNINFKAIDIYNTYKRKTYYVVVNCVQL